MLLLEDVTQQVRIIGCYQSWETKAERSSYTLSEIGAGLKKEFQQTLNSNKKKKSNSESTNMGLRNSQFLVSKCSVKSELPRLCKDIINGAPSQ